jgi:hypothetical protein
MAVRLIWHLPELEKRQVIKEMMRVSKKIIIFDIVNKKRFLKKILIGANTYPDSLNDILNFFKKEGLKVLEIIPLDVCMPYWLNIFPKNWAEKLFPLFYKLDLRFGKIISPGRYLIKLKKL